MLVPSQIERTKSRDKFFPFKEYRQWLSPEEANDTFNFILKSKDDFEPGLIYYEGELKLDPDIRDALRLAKLGSLQDFFSQKAMGMKAELEQAFGITPFDALRVEIDVLAYGNHAHFKRHIDTLVYAHRANPRVLTLVLYLQNSPAGYTGGEICFHSLGGEDIKELVPQHNMMVSFPSIAPHSVKEIHCESGDFSDYRFAVVMWIRRS